MYTSDWGPHLWYLLHITSYNLKKTDNVGHLKEILFMLKQLIPCHKCRVHYCYNLQNNKVNKINNKETAIEWLIDFHNIVNKHLDKKQISYITANNIYSKLKIDNERILYIINILNKYAVFCNYNQYINSFLKNLIKIYPDKQLRQYFQTINFNYFKRMNNNFNLNGYILQDVPLKYITHYLPIINESYNNVKIKYITNKLKKDIKSIRIFETNKNSNIKFKFRIMPNKNILFKFKIQKYTNIDNERKLFDDELDNKAPLLLIQTNYTTMHRYNINNDIAVNLKTNNNTLTVSFFPNSNNYFDIIYNYMELKN